MAGILVGRTAEVSAIEAVVDRGRRSGHPSAVAILGAAGLGKSRLIAEIGAGLDADLRITLVGYEPERSVPLAAARPLIAAVSDARADSPDPQREGTLVARDSSRWLEPVRLFEATHQAVRRSGRVLLELDDVQWMDESSIALCHYLLRAAEAGTSPLTLIAAGRPSWEFHAIVDALSRIVTDSDRFATIELGPLDQAAGVELVMSIAPGTSPARASELWAVAGGSPFWITAISQTGSAEASTTARLRRLEPDAAQLLALLAIGGRPVHETDLARQLAWARDRLSRAVEPLQAAGLAIRSDWRLQVAHDLIRAAATREIPDAARPRLHRIVAKDLEDRAGEEVRLLRAAMEHRQAAGDPLLDLAVRIVGSPGRRWLGDEGIRSLRAIADASDPLDPMTTRLDLGIAAMAADLGEHSIAMERWSRAADRHEDPIVEAEAALGAARSAQILGLAGEARAHLDRARRLTDIPWLRISADALEAAILLWTEHRATEGLAIGRAAADAARRAIASDDIADEDRSRLRATLLGALEAAFDGALQADDLEELERISNEMIEVAPQVGTDAYLRALRYGGVAMRQLARYREAERRYTECWNGARRQILPMLAVEAGTGALMCLMHLGRVEEAQALAAEVDALHARLRRPTIHQVRPVRAVREVMLASGDWRASVSDLEQDLRDEADPHYRLSTHQLLAIWLSRIGRSAMRADVIRHVTAGREDAAAAGCWRCAAEFETRSAETLARIGLAEEANLVLQGRRSTRPTRPLEHLYIRWIRGLLDPSPEAARRALSEALVEVTALELRLEEIWLRIDLARAVEADDRSAAADQLRTALRLASEAGSRNQQRQAEQELRRLGARTWRRGAARPAGATGALGVLTIREFEIARAAAAGDSNLEIAERLFLSRRTVEHHLSTILRKLELRNRTELASIDELRAGASAPTDLPIR